MVYGDKRDPLVSHSRIFSLLRAGLIDFRLFCRSLAFSYRPFRISICVCFSNVIAKKGYVLVLEDDSCRWRKVWMVSFERISDGKSTMIVVYKTRAFCGIFSRVISCNTWRRCISNRSYRKKLLGVEIWILFLKV